MSTAILERYDGLVDRVTPYLPFVPGERESFWAGLIKEIHNA